MGGIRGAPRGVGAISGCIGAGRECRYLGARKGIGDIRGHLGLVGEGVYWGLTGSVGTQVPAPNTPLHPQAPLCHLYPSGP